MKHVSLYFTVLLFAFGLSSCSDDEPKPEEPKTSVIGTWMQTSMQYSLTIPQGTVSADLIIGNPKENTVTFADDGFYESATDGNNMFKVTTQVQGTSYESTYKQDGAWGSGIWLKTGDSLQVTGQPNATIYSYHIKTLTSSTLQLESNSISALMGGTGFIDGDAPPITDFYILVTFKRP